MAEEIWVQGRIETCDAATASAVAERIWLPCEVRGRMLALRTEGSMSFSAFDELFQVLRSVERTARIGFVRGSIGRFGEDERWSTVEARGDGTLSGSAQLVANFVYALDWEQLELRRVDAATARELVPVYATLPDADSKALLATSIAPHYDGAGDILLDVLGLAPPPSGGSDQIWLAKSSALAWFDGDPDSEGDYFDLPRDELERAARARAAALSARR